MKAVARASLLALVACLFSLPAAGQKPTTPPFFISRISVQVSMPDGRPAPEGFLVQLDHEAGGMVDQCNTDGMGKCTFHPSEREVYLVIVRQPGFTAPPQRIDLTVSQTGSAWFDLRPIPGQNPGPALAVNGPASVAPAEFNIPGNARKEFERGRRSLLEQNDLASSIAHLEKAIRMHSAFPQAYTLLGLAYLGQPDPNLPKAEAALKKALELDPNYAPGCLEMGALLNEQKKYPEAEKALLHALELDPNQPEAHYELAKTYWALGRWQDAEPHAHAAAKAMPKLAPVHVVLGNIDLRKRDFPAAVQEYQEYLRMAPDGPMAPATRAMVSRLEDSLAKK
jgi:Flp pilus assembly protein TadD